MSLFRVPIDQDHADGLITSYYKPRGNRFHDGVDYRALTGTQVFAACGGTVIRASDMPRNGDFGNVIIIDHGEVIPGQHTYTLYAHLSDVDGNGDGADDGFAMIEGEDGVLRPIRAGDTIEAGDLIGVSGDSGPDATPEHLHFEVLQSENPIIFNTDPANGAIGFDTAVYAVNPLQYIYGDGDNIVYNINTVDDKPNPSDDEFATVWGDTGNDLITTPEPTTGEDEQGRRLTFTAANLYGKRGNDYLIGNINNDRLHGGFGSDTLIGGAGSDRIWGWQENADADAPHIPQRIRELADDGGNDELIGGISRIEDDNAADQLFGGNGFDTYHVGNGDIINDADNAGRVLYEGSVLVSGLRDLSQPENQYTSIDGQFTYTLNGTDLLVTVNDSEPPMSFTIQDFSSGNLGIVLRDMADTKIRTSIKVYEYWSIKESRIQESEFRMVA